MSKRQKRLRAKQRHHAGEPSAGTAQKVALGVALTAGATMAAAPAASGQNFVVTDLSDGDPGSLRQKIVDANEASGPDQIFFQSGLTGTITLEADLPEISGDPLSISGPSREEITVDGDGQFSVFRSFGTDLTVGGITVADGRRVDGGAIHVEGADLAVDYAAFVENSSVSGESGDDGGAISIVDGEAAITDSTFSANYAFNEGGAIFASSAQVSVDDSRFSTNEAFYGGGAIYAIDTDLAVTGSSFDQNKSEGSYGGALNSTFSGTLDVTGSTFSGNEAQASGGAIVAGADGEQSLTRSTFDGNVSVSNGGSAVLSYAPGGMTITNSTFAGNVAAGTAGGAIRAVSGDTAVISSTLSGNTVLGSEHPPAELGSGIVAVTGTVDLENSIVAGNTPADLSNGAAGSFSTRFDVIGAQANATVTETVPGSNVAAGEGFRMGPLADNGGPVETMLPGAAAVNQGSSPLLTDARSFTRPVDFPGIPDSAAAGANGADIGAVELQEDETPVPPAPVGPTGPTGPTQPTGPTGPTGPTTPVEPSNAFSFGGLKLNKKKGVATLKVKVPGAGRVVLLGSKTVKKSSKAASAKSTVKLTVKAKGKALKNLKKKGKARVKAKVRFTPTGGTSRTKSKSVKLVKKRR